MENETTYGPAIAVAIIVVILFFGGWYLFIGQAFNNPTGEVPVTPEINASATPIVYGTSTQATSSETVNEGEAATSAEAPTE